MRSGQEAQSGLAFAGFFALLCSRCAGCAAARTRTSLPALGNNYYIARVESVGVGKPGNVPSFTWTLSGNHPLSVTDYVLPVYMYLRYYDAMAVYNHTSERSDLTGK